jgi:1,4-dihydroxy-2-naphthoate polyprenyltransferase
LIIHSIFLVYLIGALFAIIVGARFDLIRFLYVYVILFTGTLSAMYNNNYNDVEIDRYATQTFFSGGSRILVDHPELMKSVKQLSVFFLYISVLLGLVGMILFSYSMTFFLFILFGNLLGWFYTAPPIRLIYHGLGEIGTMLAASFIVPGLGYFALKGQIDTMFLPLLLPLSFQGFALSFYLEIPDREADRLGHKNTIVVRWGIKVGLLIAVISSLLATVCFFTYAILNVSTGSINYWFIAIFSLIPLMFGCYSLLRYRVDINKIKSLVFYSASSFFVFFLLFVGYLFVIIFVA